MTTLRDQIATNVLTVTKFRELMRHMRENRPNDDLELVRKAYEYSQKNHAGQHRASGEPYLIHPLEVALVLSEMKMDGVAVAAGLLHDSVEDTSVTIVDIRKEFGEQVAHIVEGVTKISQIDFSSREEQQAENLRKMMLAMVDDIRVVLIKLADRCTICVPSSIFCRTDNKKSRRRRSTFMPQSPIAWGWEKSAASWKIWGSVISTRSAISRCRRRSRRDGKRVSSS